MIGRKAFAVACLGATTLASKRLWSPYTWMRDKEDRNLTNSIKDFFSVLKDEGDAGASDEDALIKPLGNNRVKMLDDTLLTDYITVNYWMWPAIECDEEDPSSYCDE